MATRPTLAVPYVVGTDAVSSYPSTSLALATGLDNGQFGTVPWFATAAARDAAWPSPANGAMCSTLDTGLIWRRLAGVWRPWPDWGFVNATTNASGQLVVTHRIGAVPTAIICTLMGAGGGAGRGVYLNGFTSTNFTLTVTNSAGAALVSTACSVGWTAWP
jgi:hypothetical protein